MTPTFTPDKAKVIEAVKVIRGIHRDLLNRFGLELLEDRLDLSFGTWVLPAEHHANGPYDGYDMVKAITEIQHDIEQQSGQEVTVFLEH